MTSISSVHVFSACPAQLRFGRQRNLIPQRVAQRRYSATIQRPRARVISNRRRLRAQRPCWRPVRVAYVPAQRKRGNKRFQPRERCARSAQAFPIAGRAPSGGGGRPPTQCDRISPRHDATRNDISSSIAGARSVRRPAWFEKRGRRPPPKVRAAIPASELRVQRIASRAARPPSPNRPLGSAPGASPASRFSPSTGPPRRIFFRPGGAEPGGWARPGLCCWTSRGPNRQPEFGKLPRPWFVLPCLWGGRSQAPHVASRTQRLNWTAPLVDSQRIACPVSETHPGWAANGDELVPN